MYLALMNITIDMYPFSYYLRCWNILHTFCVYWLWRFNFYILFLLFRFNQRLRMILFNIHFISKSFYCLNFRMVFTFLWNRIATLRFLTPASLLFHLDIHTIFFSGQRTAIFSFIYYLWIQLFLWLLRVINNLNFFRLEWMNT